MTLESFLTYGLGNLLGLIFLIIFNLIGLKKFKNKSYKEKLKGIRFLFHLLLTLEIIKISYNIACYGEFGIGTVPFLFCSIVLYTYYGILHTKEGSKANRLFLALSIFPEIVIGLSFLLYVPSIDTMTLSGVIFNCHSRFYHLVMATGGIYLVHMKIYDYRFKDCVLTAFTIMTYFIFCTIGSMLIGGEISILGPESIYFQFLYTRFGYVLGNIFLTIAVFLVSLLCYGTAYFIINKRKKE